MTIKGIAVALAATSAMGLAACGGGGDKALSRADLVKKALAICKDANTASDKLTQPTNIADATQAAPYFKAVAKIGHDQHDKLKKLKPAGDVKADYESFLSEEQKALDLVDGIAAAAAAKDAAKGAQLLQEIGKNTTFLAAAKKVGIGDCAS